MKQIAFQIILLVTLWNVTVCQAQNDNVFEAAVDEIVENNQALKASRASLQSELSQVKVLNQPADPEIEFEHQWGHNHIGNKWLIGVKQSIDWPGVYRSRAKSASYQAESLKAMYQSSYVQTRLDVTKAFIDYVHSRRLLSLYEIVACNMDSVAEYTRRAFEHGEMTIIDLKKVQFQQAEASLKLRRAQSLEDRLRLEIVALNDGKYIDISAVYNYVAGPLRSEDYYMTLAEQDPALVSAQASVEQTRLDMSTARMSAFPGLTVGYIHNVELGDKFDGFNIAINLPLFSSRRRKAIAAANALAAESQTYDIRSRILSNVSADYIEAKRLYEDINVYRPLFDGNQNDYVALLRKSWIGGQITTIQFIDEVNYFTDLSIEYLSLQHDYNLVLANLNRYQMHD